MSLREIIIVSIMLLTMLLGGYLHFVPQSVGNSGKETATASPALDFAKEIVSKLGEDTSFSKELLVIRQAEEKWDRDPFVSAGETPSDTLEKQTLQKEANADGRHPDFVYSGYLQAGENRLAVINGIEYAPGESIDDQGHYIRRIEPDRVVIGTLGTQRNTFISLSEFNATSGD